ncbi:bifunctional riboflavin kinase/FAD synthetase [Psychroflexus gondwanensis]|uniref:Riboflavin biosynthesis protein n=1 Tax=Psychroflexus gondwanensis ACAM 44 TaxID=1189619 RepID=N1WTZ6_9FLAO|nr:bifunctional riboflavin kinase/FAD synthetase [Psychroflexus gondwanensis]EMY80599.1 riboflavin kinase/FMN adenylyltransferase RibF [Psychroflexus gondwanensis ACAM 44]TXE19267.1 bifunctional riboflavin kinase/FAD synthetase [Psychroflexus gondwanensis]
MKIYNNVSEFDSSIPTVVTIGTFDGVHLGHRKIIKRLIDSTEKGHLQTALLTFYPHPRMVLQQSEDLKLINTIEERKLILEETGLEHLIVHPFTMDFSRLSAREYVEEILVKSLNAKKIVIGYDHHFGRNRTANIEDLKEFGKEFNFEVLEISKQDIEDVAVSSTKIRRSLEDGDLETANKYLSLPFFLSGEIVRGKGLGKNMGYPTANMDIEESYKLIPKEGVYVVASVINGDKHFGMMNIGTNPTVGGQNRSIETYFFDLDKDLYGQHLHIQLLKRIRSEVKFDGLDALVEAMRADEVFAKNYIKVFNNE